MKILFSSIAAALSIFSLISTPIAMNALETQTVSSDYETIAQALAELNSYATIQESLKIQDPDIAYAMKKAELMADLLISSTGKLKYDLCPSIKSAFIPAHPEEYEVNMSKVLDHLNASWQPFFDSVKAPDNTNFLIDLVLHSIFGLGIDVQITDRHAKVAVLGSMLSPYNQGPVGDCFAVNNVLRDHDEYYKHSADDFKSIVMHGYLKRLVNESPDYFFFLPILADDDRDQLFTITAHKNLRIYMQVALFS
jgi:hypothetical protein